MLQKKRNVEKKVEMLRKKLKYNVKRDPSTKFHDENKSICVCKNPNDTRKLHNGHNTVVSFSFFSKCVMEKKNYRKNYGKLP